MSDQEAAVGRKVRWVFWALAIFCIWVTWVPDRASLIREQGQVTSVHPHRAWVDVVITTDSGVRVTCSGKSAGNRCPEAAFLDVQSRQIPVTVWYKGDTPYEVIADGVKIIDYDQYRSAQKVIWLIVLLLLGMGYIAGRSKQDH